MLNSPFSFVYGVRAVFLMNVNLLCKLSNAQMLHNRLLQNFAAHVPSFEEEFKLKTGVMKGRCKPFITPVYLYNTFMSTPENVSSGQVAESSASLRCPYYPRLLQDHSDVT